MRARLLERPAISLFHSVLSGAVAERRSGFNPLAFTAAMKLDRILARLLPVKPAATGLTLASLALIAGRSSGIRAGSSPSKSATRLIDEFRSRRRVSER